MEREDDCVCRMCGKTFPTEADLVQHEVTVHPNVTGKREQNDKRENAA